MRGHPLLRAYMAGIVVPTVFLLVIMTVFTLARYVYDVPVPVERVVVFPMAVVPNLWGLWNMLHLAHPVRRLALGLHGALLPFLLAPTAFLVTRLVDFPIPAVVAAGFPIGFPVGVILYYLAWKHVVGFLNRLVAVG
ncbi:MAG: hypothetical protein ACRD09_09265 [Vicinamibacterales bacterium]